MKKLWLLCLCLLEASVARANIAAVQHYPAEAGALGSGAKTTLQVKEARLSLRCADAAGRPRCSFRATYLIANPTSVAAGARAAFRSLRVSEVTVAIEGRVSEGPKFSLMLEPGRTVRVVVKGQMSPKKTFRPSYAREALRTRHSLLGSEGQKSDYLFRYLIAPIRTWACFPAQIDVTLQMPSSWLALVGEPDRKVRSRIAPGDGDDRETTTLRLSTRNDELALRARLPEAIFNHGGPLIGVGGHIDDSGRFRLRAGYEIGAPRWLLWSINVDTDLRDELVIAPVAELATPGVLIIPSLGVGLGVPVRVLPDASAGLRIQLSMQWPLIGFVTSFDVYPGLETSDPRMFQVGMFAQFAL